MPLSNFKARNHPQQTEARGALDPIDDRRTTDEFFKPLDEIFHFTLDAAASVDNTKCEKFYDREIDGLTQSWHDEVVWLNPPYSNIRPWIEKAWLEFWIPKIEGRVNYGPTTTIVMLLPANRTEQAWWQDLIEPYRDINFITVHFIRGRVRFINVNDTEVQPNARPPFGVCLVVISNRDWDLRGLLGQPPLRPWPFRNKAEKLNAVLSPPVGTQPDEAKMEEAMDDFARHTTPGGTWIFEDESGEPRE